MKRLLSAASGLFGVLLLTACGFTPLYAVQGVTSGLSAIQVNVPHGRTAFLLGEDLDDAFARNRDIPPAYRLDVSVSERGFARGLNLVNTAKYFENQVTVHYKLTEIATGKVLLTAAEPVEVSYAAADQPYAGVSAQQNAQERAASEAAQRIRLDIAGYFAGKAAK